MDKKLVFGIDVDEVLRNTLPVMVDLYNKEFGTNMTVDDVTEWNVCDSFPLIKEKLGYEKPDKWFFEDHAREIFLYSPTIKGAKNAIDTIQSYGHKVMIITYQKGLTNKILTLEWLALHGIDYDDICFVKDKSQIVCDVFIDDNDWNFTGCRASQAFLVTKPYNKSVDINDLFEYKCSRHTKELLRVNSLEEAVKLIIKN